MNKRVFILFTIDDQVYALDVHSVGQIVQAAALTHVPEQSRAAFGAAQCAGPDHSGFGHPQTARTDPAARW
jgi:chemotaxis signal transduction protein